MPVVDASVVGALLLPDEDTRKATRIVGDATEILVPPLLAYEVGNLVVTALRRGRITEATAVGLTDALGQLDLTVDDRGQSTTRLIELGSSHGLSVYDAAYLSLALTAGEPLATFDARLRRVAKKAGVAVV